MPRPRLDPATYWETRYVRGGNSGRGSYEGAEIIKALHVNMFVREHGIDSVIDWGCGDGNVTRRFNVPRYVGVEVSATALKRCLDVAPQHSYVLWRPTLIWNPVAVMAMSLDVVFHLPDDTQYRDYVRRVFRSASAFVLIHGTDVDRDNGNHVRHRAFTQDVERWFPHWVLTSRPSDPGSPGFYEYAREV